MGAEDRREVRARGGGRLLAGTMVVAFAGVWLLGGRLGGPAVRSPSASPQHSRGAEPATLVTPPGPLSGRLVYPSFEGGGPMERPQRLWVIDVSSGEVTQGPRVPTVEELVAVGPDRSWVLAFADRGLQGGAAYLIRDLSPRAVPVEVATGDLVSVSNGGDAVVAVRTEPDPGAACPSARYTVVRVVLGSGLERVVARGRIACGHLVSVAGVGDRVYASMVRDGIVQTAAASGGRLARFSSGTVLHSAGPGGSQLTIEAERGIVRSLGVWPRTPTGTLSWSRGPSSRRPLSDAPLFAERIVAWSHDGRSVVVSGIVGGDRSMWLVGVGQGSTIPLLPPNSVPLRSAFSGASFDRSGTVFVGSPGEIRAVSPSGSTRVGTAPDAPRPAGPIVWLP